MVSPACPKNDNSCPSADDLSALHLGKLPPEQIAAIADHLDVCSACSFTLEGLSEQSDALLAELRRPAAAEPFSDADSLRAVQLAEATGLHLIETMGVPLGQQTTDPAESAVTLSAPAVVGQVSNL